MQQAQDSVLHISWKDQSPAELLTQAGEWLEQQGNQQQAMSYYDAATSLAPHYSLAAFRGGQLALKTRRWDDALQRLMLALHAAPDHAPTHYLASRAYLGLEKFEDALVEAEATLRYDPNHSGAFLVKLRCLTATQRWNEIERLHTLTPLKFTGAEAALMFILALCKRGDLPRAKSHYDEVSIQQRKRFRDLAQAIESILAKTP